MAKRPKTDLPKPCRLFGTDGLRGEANVTLTPELALKVGQAVGQRFRNGGTKKALVGKDTRLSCYMIECALVAGFTSAGMSVILTGPLPTPAVAALTESMRAAIGVMITASHNGYQDNGIKLFGPDGYKLSDELQKELEALMASDMSSELARGSSIGRVKRVEGPAHRYVEFAKNSVRGLKLDGVRIVIDCAHGASYIVAPETLRELGADVIAIGINPDGTNINENCGSTAPQTLIEKVLEARADFGIALDGDADRVLLVDEKGCMIDGDQILATIATDWLSPGRLKRPVVAGTVMSNLGLERYLHKLGIKFMRTKVGDRYVLEAMREHDLNLGGETSGHILMPDFTRTGDGLIAALQILSVMKRRCQPASVIAHKFERVPQVHKNVKFAGTAPLTRPTVQRIIKASERMLGKNGRLIVRPSGTEPVIRIMAEGDNPAQLEKITASIADAISRAK